MTKIPDNVSPGPYHLEWEDDYDEWSDKSFHYPGGIVDAKGKYIMRFDDDYGTDPAADGRVLSVSYELLEIALELLGDGRDGWFHSPAGRSPEMHRRLMRAVVKAIPDYGFEEE